MDTVKELFSLDYSSLLFGIFVILASIIAVYEIIARISEIIGKPVKWLNQKNDDHKNIDKAFEEIKKLQEQQNEDRKQSILHDKKLEECMSKISDSVNSINTRLDEMENKNNKAEMAKLKDIIAKSYRRYHKTKEWTLMDKESFEGLIRLYEQCGGTNSFVHEICEPESLTWKIIEDE